MKECNRVLRSYGQIWAFWFYFCLFVFPGGRVLCVFVLFLSQSCFDLKRGANESEMFAFKEKAV